MYKKALSLLLALMLIVTSLSVAVVSVAAADDDPPQTTEDTYIVAGSPAEIFGTAWDATNDDNAMTAVGDGTYTKTYTATKEEKGVQLKVVKNGTEWIGNSNGGNVTFDLTGAGEFTVTLDSDTQAISVTGDNVFFKASIEYDTVYAVGNGEGSWLNGAAWDPAYPANEMTKVDDDVWEISFAGVPDGFERQVKFALDGAWTYNFGGTFVESGTETEAALNGDNITFDTYDDSQTVTLRLDLSEFDYSNESGAKFTLTITPDSENEGSTAAPDEDETTEPAPATTAAPETTAPGTDAGDDESDEITVTATSNYFPTTVSTFTKEQLEENGNLVTVTYFLQSEMNMVNAEWMLTYDGTALTFDPADNTAGLMPCAPGALYNNHPFSVAYGVKGNCTSLVPYFLSEKNGDPVAFVTATFKVKSMKDSTVDLNIYEALATTDASPEQTQTENEVQVLLASAVAADIAHTATSAVYAGPYDEDYEAPTAAPTTASPVTDEPTTDAPATENTYVVAGQPAEIFGTAWDATNEDNLMVKGADDKFAKTYTVEKGYTDVQFKVVRTALSGSATPPATTSPST